MNKTIAALIFAFVIIYLIPLNVRPLVIPDETRYAEIPREMLTTGNWVVPKLNGLRYFEKPVLGYWLNAASLFLLGENAFAVRLPSALAAGLSSLLIFFVVRRFYDGGLSAWLSAAAYMTSFEVFGVGTFCVLDSVFSMFVTATLVVFFFAWKERASTHKQRLYLALAGVCCGMAFLTKGFIAFVVPVSVIAPFLLWQRQWKQLLTIWWIPLTAAFLTALPWCIAIHVKEPDYWRYFFWQEHIQRFLNPDPGQHAKPFWYFVPFLLAGALPWSTWLPNAFRGLKHSRLSDSLIRFSVCWLVFPFLFFSASSGKLGTYILPCFPPLIILLVSGFLKSHASSDSEIKFRKELYVSAGFMCFGTVAFLFTQVGPFAALKIYPPEEAWKWMLLGTALLVYAVCLLIAARQKLLGRRLFYCCLAPMIVLFAAPFVIPDRVKSGKMPGTFLSANKSLIHPETILVSDSTMAPAVCWFYQRNDVYLFESSGELKYGLDYDDAQERVIDRFGFEAFLNHHPGGGNVVLITREKRYAGYSQELPTPLRQVCSDGFVLAEYGPGNAENESLHTTQH